MQDLNEFLDPGMLVQHPFEKDWGVGQVQSRVNGKITVNFTEVGKVVIDGSKIALLQFIEKDQMQNFKFQNIGDGQFGGNSSINVKG